MNHARFCHTDFAYIFLQIIIAIRFNDVNRITIL